MPWHILFFSTKPANKRENLALDLLQCSTSSDTQIFVNIDRYRPANGKRILQRCQLLFQPFFIPLPTSCLSFYPDMPHYSFGEAT